MSDKKRGFKITYTGDKDEVIQVRNASEKTLAFFMAKFREAYDEEFEEQFSRIKYELASLKNGEVRIIKTRPIKIVLENKNNNK